MLQLELCNGCCCLILLNFTVGVGSLAVWFSLSWGEHSASTVIRYFSLSNSSSAFKCYIEQRKKASLGWIHKHMDVKWVPNGTHWEPKHWLYSKVHSVFIMSQQAGKNWPTVAPFWRKATQTPFFDTWSPIIWDSESFHKSNLAQTTQPFFIYNQAKN